MPPGTTILSPEDRDYDGYYHILPGHTHIFKFIVPSFGLNKIGVAHVMSGTQDWSLDCWISSSPLDGVQFSKNADMNHFGIPRVMKEFEIWDEKVAPEGTLTLPSNRIFYINVKNLQNRDNTYKLVFSV